MKVTAYDLGYEQGWLDGMGLGSDSNPFPVDSQAFLDWEVGFTDGQSDA